MEDPKVTTAKESQKEEEKSKSEQGNNNKTRTRIKSPRDVIRETIITGVDDQNKNVKSTNPEDVLVFSRSVNNIDSSLD